MLEAGRSVAPGADPRLTLKIDAGEREVQSAALNVRVQIRPERRRYTETEVARLWELFGPADQWARSLGPIPWAGLKLEIRPFVGNTTVEVLLPRQFEFGAAAPKYLAALEAGVVPLELLFSGTVTWTSVEGRPQTAMVPWDREAMFRMPLAGWREVRRSP